jgi:hypothetical protein
MGVGGPYGQERHRITVRRTQMPTVRHSFLAAAAALLGLAAASPAPASASGSSLAVSATNTGTADQVTLAFTGAEPALTVTADGNPPFGIGSGKEMPIGDSTFYIHFHCPMSCWSGNITNNVPAETLPQVRGVRTQNFEGELAIDIGLAHQASYTITPQGSSLIVTVQH